VLAAVLVPGVARADPQARCTLDDPRLAETSGLVVADDGAYEVVNDSGNPSTVYRLDASCAVVGEIEVPRQGRDVEDLARSADGTLWLADIGDNDRERATVAVLRVSPGGEETITRFTYPDGAHDAESLLMPGDDRPVIVTKDLSGRSGIYVADPGSSVLRRAGEVVVPGEAITSLGAGAYTGGAISADGRVVALRTYADAWLYPAPDGTATADDVVAALAGAPVRVPLPDEVQGEALAFAPDGTLLSTGETPREGPAAPLHAVPGATALVGVPSVPSEPPAVPPPDRAGLPEPLASIGVVLAVAAGVFALVAVVAVVRRRRG
jgi:sugar lactone lactonase YvrE